MAQHPATHKPAGTQPTSISEHRRAPDHTTKLPSTADLYAQRTQSYIRRIDGATETLSARFQDIMSVAAVAGKDRQTTATECYQIEANTASLIRAAEDLLSLTRELKEEWLLGDVSPYANAAARPGPAIDVASFGQKLETLLKDGTALPAPVAKDHAVIIEQGFGQGR